LLYFLGKGCSTNNLDYHRIVKLTKTTIVLQFNDTTLMTIKAAPDKDQKLVIKEV